MNKEEPLVSVVIPTYNSQKYLEKCLKSIVNQTYENVEIIVVDNNSTDNTKRIARKYTSKIFSRGPERSAQLNYGIKKAEGKYVYRVDSDFLVEPQVIEEAVKKCIEEGYDAICVHNTSNPTVGFWSKIRKLERDCYKGDKLNVAARFVRKEVFEELGGFEEDLVAGEDYDFHNRLREKGFKIGIIDAEEIHMGEPRSLADIIKKHYYYGKTIEEFIKRNKYTGIKQLFPIRLAYVRNFRKFLNQPVLTLGFILYNFTRYLSAVIGLLVSKCKNK